MTRLLLLYTLHTTDIRATTVHCLTYKGSLIYVFVSCGFYDNFYNTLVFILTLSYLYKVICTFVLSHDKYYIQCKGMSKKIFELFVSIWWNIAHTPIVFIRWNYTNCIRSRIIINKNGTVIVHCVHTIFENHVSISVRNCIFFKVRW